ncbi:hypothetical protein M8J77_014996 [Diaphorina citri]|nr:hypothetical protein M8J77_014996 [Diaphorina citri]
MCWWSNKALLNVENVHRDKLPNVMDLQTELFPAIFDSKYSVNDYCKAPSTPLKRNRSGASKHIELTPLWQQIAQYKRFPLDVDKTKVFIELESRLNDPEWEVRQHALKFCIDLIPSLDAEDLNGQSLPVLLYSIVNNLGNPAPAVRFSTVDVILTYIKHCADPESFVQSFVSQSLESTKVNPNLTLVALHCLPIFLNQIQQLKRKVDSQIFLKIVQSVSKKMILVTYQKEAVECLSKIKAIVGHRRFLSILDHFYPQVKEDFDMLCRVYLVNNSNVEHYTVDKDRKSSDSYSSSATNKTNSYLYKSKQVRNRNAGNDESSDDPDNANARAQYIPDMNKFETFSKRHDSDEVLNLNQETSTESNPYETFQGNVDTAIGNEYLTQDLNNEQLDDCDDLYEEIFGKDNIIYSSDVDDYDPNSISEDIKRTSRRVTFGGEIVKLRTPDSDQTVEDLKVTIDNKTRNGKLETSNSKSPTRSSHIPVPIFPAIKKPLEVKQNPAGTVVNEGDDDSTIPTLDGGESLTSSSSSNEQYLRPPQDDHSVENVDLLRLGIVDRDVLDNLPRRVSPFSFVAIKLHVGYISPENEDFLPDNNVGFCLNKESKVPKDIFAASGTRRAYNIEQEYKQ